MRTLLLALIAPFFLIDLSIADSSSPRFKIGVIAPLSGPLAEYGAAVRNGFDLALKQVPEIGSSIQFIFEDDQYDSKKSVNAFNKLRESDSVDLVYLWGTGPAQAVAPIAEAKRFPLVVMSIDPSPALGREWVIRFGNYSEQHIIKILEYLRNKHVKNIALVRTELGYIDSMVTALRANLRPDESITEIASLQPGESDIKPVITRLQGKRFDALALYLMSGQISQFFNSSVGRVSTGIVFGTDFFESRDEVKKSGPGINSAVFPNNGVEKWFLDTYQKTYRNDSQITFAANAYDFAILAGDLFREDAMGNRSSIDIKKRLSSVAPRSGASGDFQFKTTPQGGQYFEFPLVIRQITGEQIVTVQ